MLCFVQQKGLRPQEKKNEFSGSLRRLIPFSPGRWLWPSQPFSGEKPFPPGAMQKVHHSVGWLGWTPSSFLFPITWEEPPTIDWRGNKLCVVRSYSTQSLAVPKFSRDLLRLIIGPSMMDAFRVNRDQVMDLEKWFKFHRMGLQSSPKTI